MNVERITRCFQRKSSSQKVDVIINYSALISFGKHIVQCTLSYYSFPEFHEKKNNWVVRETRAHGEKDFFIRKNTIFIQRYFFKLQWCWKVWLG